MQKCFNAFVFNKARYVYPFHLNFQEKASRMLDRPANARQKAQSNKTDKNFLDACIAANRERQRATEIKRAREEGGETDRQRDRDRESETDRQRESETDRQADGQRQKQKD